MIKHESAAEQDAIFLGWQETLRGDPFPLFVITRKGHPYFGSTVSEKKLRELQLKIPAVKPLRNQSRKRTKVKHA